MTWNYINTLNSIKLDVSFLKVGYSPYVIQNIELYSTTIYIFMLLQYNKLSRYNDQAL
jgi:hypothetical protein